VYIYCLDCGCSGLELGIEADALFSALLTFKMSFISSWFTNEMLFFLSSLPRSEIDPRRSSLSKILLKDALLSSLHPITTDPLLSSLIPVEIWIIDVLRSMLFGIEMEALLSSFFEIDMDILLSSLFGIEMDVLLSSLFGIEMDVLLSSLFEIERDTLCSSVFGIDIDVLRSSLVETDPLLSFSEKTKNLAISLLISGSLGGVVLGCCSEKESSESIVCTDGKEGCNFLCSSKKFSVKPILLVFLT